MERRVVKEGGREEREGRKRMEESKDRTELLSSSDSHGPSSPPCHSYHILPEINRFTVILRVPRFAHPHPYVPDPLPPTNIAHQQRARSRVGLAGSLTDGGD